MTLGPRGTACRVPTRRVQRACQETGVASLSESISLVGVFASTDTLQAHCDAARKDHRQDMAHAASALVEFNQESLSGFSAEILFPA